MQLAPLYEIAAEHRALYDKLMDMDADEQAIIDTLQAETDMIPKVQSYGLVIRNMEALEVAVNVEAERLAMRAKLIAKRMAAIKQRATGRHDICQCVEGRTPAIHDQRGEESG